MWKGEPVVPDKAELKERELLQMERQEAWPWSEATKPGGCAERISHYWRTASWNQNFVWDCLDLFCHKCNIFFKKVKKNCLWQCLKCQLTHWSLVCTRDLHTASGPVETATEVASKKQKPLLCSWAGAKPYFGQETGLQHPGRGGEGEERERERERRDLSHSVSELVLCAIISVWDTFMEVLRFHYSILTSWWDILVFYNDT